MGLQDLDASRPPPHTHHGVAPKSSSHGSNSTANATTLQLGAPAQEADDSEAMQHLLTPHILIKPHPPNLTVKPRSLQPLMLLPREHLHLSFFDLSSPYGSFEPSISFDSNIKILDLERRIGGRHVVLLARLESNQSVYAVELRSDGLYSLCKLGSWVDLERLCEHATVSCSHLIRMPDKPQGQPNASLPLTTPQLSHNSKKRRLAIEAIQSLVKKPKRSLSVSAPSQLSVSLPPSTPVCQARGQEPQARSATDTPRHAQSRGSSDRAVDDRPNGPPTPIQSNTLIASNDGSILTDLQRQYMDALYFQKESLAYFAKGPLSRARAAYHYDCDSTLEMGQLVGFLKSLTMATTLIDKKYRDTIPAILSQMKINVDETDADQSEPKPRKGQPKRYKKYKLRKDGLWNYEDDLVKNWWTAQQSLFKDDEETNTKSTKHQDIKVLISRLRSRETQLQMIILLEVLALEPLLAHETLNDATLPGFEPTKDSSQPKDDLIKKKSKNDLLKLLNTHADRLCIWQSTILDEFDTLNESQGGAGRESQKSSKATADPLKDFCRDIIIPFFSARLPEHCDSINKKLGGPVMQSSPKSTQKRVITDSRVKTKPGAATKRPALKPTRTLDRVLSKETQRNRRSMSRGPSGVIALMRSASTPTIPLLKREASETASLDSISRAEPNAPHERETSQVSATSVKRRSADAKEKRDAFVKAELQDAISTLRRPNRESVSIEIVEASERRATTSLSQLRKSRKPTQHPRFQDVVKATPAGNRFHNVLESNRHPRSASSLQVSDAIPEEYDVPSSSRVPESAPRKRLPKEASDREALSLPNTHALIRDQVTATPAKPSTLSRPFVSAPDDEDGVVPASSPVMSRKISQPKFLAVKKPVTLDHRDSGIGMLPSSPRLTLTATPMKVRQNGVFQHMDHYVTVTPVKRRLSDSVPVSTAGKNENTEPLPEAERATKTVYQRLGWDDYDDLA
ncbi:DNA replication regulator SLD3-domain-containing protein [Xylariaceae sp. FL1019]|nr:DNA replication regulator SLD3-domain-containing protein [Xylariaceae sp. FL1019]